MVLEGDGARGFPDAHIALTSIEWKSSTGIVTPRTQYQFSRKSKQEMANPRPRMKQWAMTPRTPGNFNKEVHPQLNPRTR